MKDIIQSFLEEKILREGVSQENLFYEFLFYALEYSIPYNLSSAITKISMQDANPESIIDNKIMAEEVFPGRALDLYDSHIRGDVGVHSVKSVSSLDSLFDDIQMEIRRQKGGIYF